MSHTAFFYGTLMAPPVLRRVIWGSSTNATQAQLDSLKIRPAILRNYQRHKVNYADYPAILPTPDDKNSSVRGTLVTGLTDGDIWRLDIFEGSEYERRRVKVRLLSSPSASGSGSANGEEQGTRDNDIEGEGEEIEAETYVWISPASSLEAAEWDFSEFVRDKMKRWVGKEGSDYDEGFQDVDDAVAALQDPTGGRGANGKITQELEQNGRAEEDIVESAV
ncbi:hypothetical protein K491DRAFT_691352 [Lophiostoma macrostomum CBS 122681]|uniref:Putative gamma-glutamylcyclotransferase n=1 Tax=Lophiostoma macrostomum CBS 122681 TaxID=1314788 RepID=A0A6A6TCV8_9PLEO|nr:hypothetical protein K491DRAFT_691352 [Lophiostoma macrostomum CBS 122681]